MNISIRNTLPADFESVFNLLSQLWPDTSLDLKSLETVYKNTLTGTKDFALCALFENRIVGFCAGSISINFWHVGDVCYVSTLVVDDDFRGKHIGSTLMYEVKNIAQRRNCKAIELDSGFQRETAHIFYEQLGFNKRAFTFSLEL